MNKFTKMLIILTCLIISPIISLDLTAASSTKLNVNIVSKFNESLDSFKLYNSVNKKINLVDEEPSIEHLRLANISKDQFLNNFTPHYQRTSVELVAILLGIWAYDHYWVGYEWADISIKSVKENLRHGFQWDTGKFSMNQILHPYSGNISFNTARSNGFDFIDSIPFVFWGSMGWELFMENHYPSINDIITTTVSGTALGEVFFRISDMTLDNEATGIEFFLRELLSSAISPVYGVNRNIDSNRYGNGNRLPKPPIAWSISLGGQYQDPEDYEETASAGIALGLHLVYGEEFTSYEIEKPYDYFKFYAAMEAPKGNSTGLLIIYGNLLTKQSETLSGIRYHHGLFQEFVYYDNSLYKLSASNLGYGYNNTIEIDSHNILTTRNFLYWIVLGGSDSSYPMMEGIDLEYNLGPGLSYHNIIELQTYFGVELSFNYMGYWFKTVQGSKGEEIVSYTTMNFEIPVYKSINYTIVYISYNRLGNYKNFPEVRKHNEAIRTSIQLQF